MKRALIFPGQGGQTVGMGLALNFAYPEAHEVFQEVDDALGQDLSGLMFNGSQAELNLPENARPAIMAVSVAVARVLETQSGKPLAKLADCIAGHSLGEYSALTAAGSFSVSDMAAFLKRNSQDIQRLVPPGTGAMAVLTGINWAHATEIAAEASPSKTDMCVAANDNGYTQVVISGHRSAVTRAMEIAARNYSALGVLLPVNMPGHSPLLASLEPEMHTSLIGIYQKPPSLPWFSNATAKIVDNAADVPGLLAGQMSRPVRWRETVLHMRSLGVDQYMESGPGKLAGLVHYLDSNAAICSLTEPKGIEKFLKEGFSAAVTPRLRRVVQDFIPPGAQ